jgi:hypothetical protein
MFSKNSRANLANWRVEKVEESQNQVMFAEKRFTEEFMMV